MKELAINGGEPTSPKVLGYGHQDINEDDIKAVEDCLRGGLLDLRSSDRSLRRVH